VASGAGFDILFPSSQRTAAWAFLSIWSTVLDCGTGAEKTGTVRGTSCNFQSSVLFRCLFLMPSSNSLAISSMLRPLVSAFTSSTGRLASKDAGEVALDALILGEGFPRGPCRAIEHGGKTLPIQPGKRQLPTTWGISSIVAEDGFRFEEPCRRSRWAGGSRFA